MFSALSETGTLPKYLAAAQAVRDAVARGRFAPGARLPGERVLARRFGIAHMTLRRALDELVTEGVLERSPGRGTFVARRPEAPNICVLAFNVRNIDPDGLTARTWEVVRVAAGPERQVRIMSVPEPLPPAEQLVAELRAMKVGALGLIGFRNPQAAFIGALTDEIPGVLFLKGLAGVDLPCARFDHAGAARLAVEYLLRRGRRRISVGPLDIQHEEFRQLGRALESEFRERGVSDARHHWFESWSPEPASWLGLAQTEHWIDRLLALPDRPDAIFLLARVSGYLEQRLAEEGLGSGVDLDVIEYTVLSRHSSRAACFPRLDRNFEDAVEAGVRMLLDLLEEGRTPDSGGVFCSTPELILPDDPVWAVPAIPAIPAEGGHAEAENTCGGGTETRFRT